MITHEGRRYRRADAIKVGIIHRVDVVTEGEEETVTVEAVEGTVEDPSTKVEEPTVTKVVEPEVTKTRGRRTSAEK